MHGIMINIVFLTISDVYARHLIGFTINKQEEVSMAESISLAVTGMKCGGCESNVSMKLKDVEGVITVVASSKDNKVDVTFDPVKTALKTIVQVITDAGFLVEP